jgi:hypothetical protein
MTYQRPTRAVGNAKVIDVMFPPKMESDMAGAGT